MARSSKGSICAALVLALAGSVAVHSAQKHFADSPLNRPLRLRARSDLVLVNVTVVDPNDRLVHGLSRESFHLEEDEVEQNVSHFYSEDTPVSVGFMMDVSGSMGDKLYMARKAASTLFNTAHAGDEFFLVKFASKPELLAPFTANIDLLTSKLKLSRAKGRTALLDAIHLSLRQMKKAHNQRRALVILSDGGDNASRYTEMEIRNLVREQNAQLFVIGLFEPISKRARTTEELSGPGLLEQVAEESGGHHYPIDQVEDLPELAEKIASEMHSQYVLGYRPSNSSHDGAYRRVRVSLRAQAAPGTRVYWRRGYYAPVE